MKYGFVLVFALSMFKGIKAVANIIPNIDQIKKSRQSPTPGELNLLEALSLMFDENTNIFFQPCFNGDRPDIVLLNIASRDMNPRLLFFLSVTKILPR